MSNTFPCVDFDIDTNTWRVDTGHEFIGPFTTEHKARWHCIQIVDAKSKNDRDKLHAVLAELIYAKYEVWNSDSLVSEIIDKLVEEGWHA